MSLAELGYRVLSAGSDNLSGSGRLAAESLFPSNFVGSVAASFDTQYSPALRCLQPLARSPRRVDLLATAATDTYLLVVETETAFRLVQSIHSHEVAMAALFLSGQGRDLVDVSPVPEAVPSWDGGHTLLEITSSESPSSKGTGLLEETVVAKTDQCQIVAFGHDRVFALVGKREPVSGGSFTLTAAEEEWAKAYFLGQGVTQDRLHWVTMAYYGPVGRAEPKEKLVLVKPKRELLSPPNRSS